MYSMVKRHGQCKKTTAPVLKNLPALLRREKPRSFDLFSRDRSGAALRAESKDIWEALGNEGLQMTYHVFHMTVWRARKTRKPTETSARGKQDKRLSRKGCKKQKWKQLKGGSICESKAIGGRQAWFSLAWYTKFENVGAWNRGHE